MRNQYEDKNRTSHDPAPFLAFGRLCRSRRGLSTADLIKQLAATGMTMVIVTHDMAFAREVATQVSFMDGGLIQETATPTELFAHPKDLRLQEFLSKVL